MKKTPYFYSRHLFALLLLLVTSSCLELTEVDFPVAEVEEKPVVFCFLTPGDSIFAKFTLSKLLVQHDSTVQLSPEEISVSLFSDSSKIDLVCIDAEELLFANSQENFKIIPGNTYLLKGTVRGHDIEAWTTVPDKTVRYASAVYVENKYVKYYTEIKGRISLTWDGYSKQNGFIIECIEIIELEGDASMIQNNDSNKYIMKYFSLPSSSTSNFNYSSLWYDSFADNSLEEIKTYNLYVTDINMKRYYETGMLIHETEREASNDRFMFLFRGVLPNYTNIDGGYGIFGSYLWCDKFVTEYNREKYTGS
jgi:hypothetical protein